MTKTCRLLVWMVLANGGLIEISQGTVQIPPVIAGETASPFTVTADGNAVPTYVATVCALSVADRVTADVTTYYNNPGSTATAGFCSFDLTGSTTIRGTSPVAISAAKILPSSRGIVPSISGNVLTFSVSQAGPLTVEINGQWISSIHIFVNPIDTNVPSPTDPNVIYYAPGVHHVGNVDVGSGKTVYIAPGAIVYGSASSGAIFQLNGTNITLRGRGIIDGSGCAQGTMNVVSLTGSQISVEGVILRDSPCWTVKLFSAENVEIENIKEIGYRGNTDGIDICNSESITVDGCFLRTFDDLVVVKTNISPGQDSSDISVTNCVLWNELAHALSVGLELVEDVHDVTFANCDVIHDKGRAQVLDVHDADSAEVHDILWNNLRIEEAQQLLTLWVGVNTASVTTDRGSIDNCTLQNITVTMASPASSHLFALVGYDPTHAVSNTLFYNVIVNGQMLTPDMGVQNPCVYGVGYTLSPVADAYVQDGTSAGLNFGSSPDCAVKADTVNYNREAFFRFNVAGLAGVEQAQVVLVPDAVLSDGPTTTLSYEIAANDTWSESGILWGNKPGSSSVLQTVTGYSVGQPVAVDVTETAQGQAEGDGLLSLRVRSLTSGLNRLITFGSRENATLAYRPVLQYTTLDRRRPPVADSFVQDGTSASTNFGAYTTASVKLDTVNYNREAFFRFDVSDLATASTVKIVLFPTAVLSDGATTTLSYEIASSDTWSETGITWNNKPGSSSTVGTVTGYAVGQPITIDVTSQAKAQASGDGLLSIRVRSTTSGVNRMITFGTRENSDPSCCPYLEYEP